jgi:hypothetical protein
MNLDFIDEETRGRRSSETVPLRQGLVAITEWIDGWGEGELWQNIL